MKRLNAWFMNLPPVSRLALMVGLSALLTSALLYVAVWAYFNLIWE